MLLAATETPAGVVRIANARLTQLRSRSELRREQLDAVLGDPFLARPAAARLVCGDMNATPGTPEMGWLLGGETRHWHVVDAYLAADGPEMRATISDRNGHVTRHGRARAGLHLLAGGHAPRPPVPAGRARDPRWSVDRGVFPATTSACR